jgi:hypothetical protein
MKSWEPNLDPVTGLIGYATWGNLGKTDPEVDSAWHTCHYLYFAKILGQKKDLHGNNLGDAVDSVLEKFTHSPGIFRRFPTKGQNKEGKPIEAHFNNPINLSRDNNMPIVLMMGSYGYYKELQAFSKHMLKRYSFFQNYYATNGKKKPVPDFATPDHWCVIWRAMVEARRVLRTSTPAYECWMYPWICVGDIFNIISNLMVAIHSWYEPNHAPSELGHVARTFQADLVLPTPFGWLAKIIYVYGRRRATDNLPDKIYHVDEEAKKLRKVTWKARIKYMLGPMWSWGPSVEDRYWDRSPIMSGLNFFFRFKQDAPFPEYLREAIRKHLDRRA